MERVAENAGVALTANVPAEGVSLLADRRAIKQILLNLLSNALKFTPAGGTVGVAVAAIQDHVQVCVRDNGVGNPNDKLAGLGRPFEQVSDNAAHARQGTGLGLALIHGLVAKHGGCCGSTARWARAPSSRSIFPSCRRRARLRSARCVFAGRRPQDVKSPGAIRARAAGLRMPPYSIRSENASSLCLGALAPWRLYPNRHRPPSVGFGLPMPELDLTFPGSIS